MKEMCAIVFRSVLQYCVKTLQSESDASVTDPISEDDQDEDVYCTVLYNDETHTFDQVTLSNLLIGFKL